MNDSTDSFSIDEASRIGKEIVLTTAIMFLPALLYGRPAENAFDNPVFHLAYLSQALPHMLLLLYLIENIGNRNKADYGFRSGGKPDIARCIGLTIVVLLASALVSTIPLEELFGLPSPQTTRLSRPELVPLVLVVCIATGYREELFFRAYLPRELSRLGRGRFAAQAAPLALFALAHLHQGPRGVFSALALGLVFVAAYHRTGSLHVCAWAHGLYNFAVLLASLLQYLYF